MKKEKKKSISPAARSPLRSVDAPGSVRQFELLSLRLALTSRTIPLYNGHRCTPPSPLPFTAPSISAVPAACKIPTAGLRHSPVPATHTRPSIHDCRTSLSSQSAWRDLRVEPLVSPPLPTPLGCGIRYEMLHRLFIAPSYCFLLPSSIPPYSSHACPAWATPPARGCGSSVSPEPITSSSRTPHRILSFPGAISPSYGSNGRSSTDSDSAQLHPASGRGQPRFCAGEQAWPAPRRVRPVRWQGQAEERAAHSCSVRGAQAGRRWCTGRGSASWA